MHTGDHFAPHRHQDLPLKGADLLILGPSDAAPERGTFRYLLYRPIDLQHPLRELHFDVVANVQTIGGDGSVSDRDKMLAGVLLDLSVFVRPGI